MEGEEAPSATHRKPLRAPLKSMKNMLHDFFEVYFKELISPMNFS